MSVTVYRCSVPGLTAPRSASTSATPPVAFFFQKPLHDLELHRQLADLGLHPLELALRPRRVPPLEPVRAALEKDPPPPLELVHGYLHLPRDRPELLALQEPQYDLRLRPRTPPLG